MSSLSSDESFDFEKDFEVDLDLDDDGSEKDTGEIISAIEDYDLDSPRKSSNINSNNSTNIRTSIEIKLDSKKSDTLKSTGSLKNVSKSQGSLRSSQNLKESSNSKDFEQNRPLDKHEQSEHSKRSEHSEHSERSEHLEHTENSIHTDDDIKRELEAILQKAKAARKPPVPRSKSTKKIQPQSEKQVETAADPSSYKNRKKNYNPDAVRVYMLKQKLQRAKEKSLKKQQHQEEEDSKRIALAAIQQKALEEAARTQKKKKISASNPLPPFIVGDVQEDENQQPKTQTHIQTHNQTHNQAHSDLQSSKKKINNAKQLNIIRSAQSIENKFDKDTKKINTNSKNRITDLKHLFPQLTTILNDDESSLESTDESYSENDYDTMDNVSIESISPRETKYKYNEQRNNIQNLSSKENVIKSNESQKVEQKIVKNEAVQLNIIKKEDATIQTPKASKFTIEQSKILEQLKEATRKLTAQLQNLQENKNSLSSVPSSTEPSPKTRRSRPSSPSTASNQSSNLNQSLDNSFNLPFEELPRKSQIIARPKSATHAFSHRVPSQPSSARSSIYSNDLEENLSKHSEELSELKKFTFSHRKEAWTEDLIPPREEIHIPIVATSNKQSDIVGISKLKDVPPPPPSTKKPKKSSKEKDKKKEKKDKKRSKSTKKSGEHLSHGKTKRSKSSKKTRKSKTPKKSIQPTIKLSEKEQREALMLALRRAAQKSPSKFSNNVTQLLLNRSNEFSSDSKNEVKTKPKVEDIVPEISETKIFEKGSNFRLIDVISMQNEDFKRKKDERLREALKQHINKISNPQRIGRKIDSESKLDSTQNETNITSEESRFSSKIEDTLIREEPAEKPVKISDTEVSAIAKVRQDLQSLLKMKLQARKKDNESEILDDTNLSKSDQSIYVTEESQEVIQIESNKNVDLPTFKEFQNQRPPDNRLSPSSLERKMHQVLEVYDKTQESWMQIELMKYNQQIAEVNQEAASLAQILHAKQLEIQSQPHTNAFTQPIKPKATELQRDINESETRSSIPPKSTQIKNNIEYENPQINKKPKIQNWISEFEDVELKSLISQRNGILEKYQVKERLLQVLKNKDSSNSLHRFESKMAIQKAKDLSQIDEAIEKREREIHQSLKKTEKLYSEAEVLKEKLDQVLNSSQIPDVYSVFDSIDLESNYDSDSSAISITTDDTETNGMMQEYLFLKQQRRNNSDELEKRRKNLEKRRKLAEKILNEKKALEEERQLESQIREEENRLVLIEAQINEREELEENQKIEQIVKTEQYINILPTSKEIIEETKTYEESETESFDSKASEIIETFEAIQESDSTLKVDNESTQQDKVIESNIYDPTSRIANLNKDLELFKEKRLEQKKRLLQQQQDELQEQLEMAKGEIIFRQKTTDENNFFNNKIQDEINKYLSESTIVSDKALSSISSPKESPTQSPTQSPYKTTPEKQIFEESKYSPQEFLSEKSLPLEGSEIIHEYENYEDEIDIEKTSEKSVHYDEDINEKIDEFISDHDNLSIEEDFKNEILDEENSLEDIKSLDQNDINDENIEEYLDDSKQKTSDLENDLEEKSLEFDEAIDEFTEEIDFEFKNDLEIDEPQTNKIPQKSISQEDYDLKEKDISETQTEENVEESFNLDNESISSEIESFQENNLSNDKSTFETTEYEHTSNIYKSPIEIDYNEDNSNINDKLNELENYNYKDLENSFTQSQKSEYLENDRETPEDSEKLIQDLENYYQISEKIEESQTSEEIEDYIQEQHFEENKAIKEDIELKIVDELVGKYVDEAFNDIESNLRSLNEKKIENQHQKQIENKVDETLQTTKDNEFEETQVHSEDGEIVEEQYSDENLEESKSIDAGESAETASTEDAQLLSTKDYIDNTWESVQKYVEIVLKKANLPEIDLFTQKESVPLLMDELYLDIEKQMRNKESQQIFHKMIFDCINEAIADYNGYLAIEQDKKLYKSSLFSHRPVKKYIGGASQGTIELPILPEIREPNLKKFIFEKIARLLEYSKSNVGADFALIDLIQPTRSSNRIQWGDYYAEEQEIKNEITDWIFDELIKDTAQWILEVNQKVTV